jgi:hypothetical protein
VRTLKKAIQETNVIKPKKYDPLLEDISGLYKIITSNASFLGDLKVSEVKDVADFATIVYDLLHQGRDWACSRVQMSTELLYRAMLKNGLIREEVNSLVRFPRTN